MTHCVPMQASSDPSSSSEATRTRRVLGAVVATLALVGVGLFGFTSSEEYRLGDSFRGLRQLDLLYLDEPAPGLAALDIASGRPALIVVCEGCAAPALRDPAVQVIVTASEEVARDYGLLTASGRVGPGYAIVDGAGRVRYRTFDPQLSTHPREIDILIAGLQ